MPKLIQIFVQDETNTQHWRMYGLDDVGRVWFRTAIDSSWNLYCLGIEQEEGD